MDNKVIAGLLALGLIIGGLAVYPIARASQPVRTVTKTKPVYQKITNGMMVSQVAKLLGTPAGQTTQPSAKNNGISCWAWLGKPSSRALARGDWQITFCVKTQ